MSPFDLVKQLKPLYAPSPRHPAIVEVPELCFLMIDGRGDPNSAEAYQDALGALYGVAYTLKFALKKTDPERDFKVAPLEGLWWTDAEPPSMVDMESDKDSWNWMMMSAVPDAVTAAAAQIMYIGPYADEAPTIAALHAFVEEQGYELRGRHHEIYLGDPRRTAPERLKTVIRHPVRPA